MRIRKDDQVIVIGGKDAGKTGPRDAHRAEAEPRLRRGPQHRQAPRTPALGQRRLARRRGRRDRREGGADPRLQRDAARPQRQQADPRRRAPRRRRQARAVREAQRGVASDGGHRNPDPGRAAAAPPRALPAGGAAGAGQEIQVLDADAGADADQDHPQHGGRRGQAEQQNARSGAGAAGDDRRPAAQRAPRPQVDRLLQSPRGDAGRRLRHPAPGADVGVPRPPLLDRRAADPRLPRPQPALLRRPRQLLDGRQGAADLPRNRLRLDRRGPRSRHHDHDHRADRTSRPSSCCSRWACPSPRRAVPAAPTRRSSTKKRRRSARRRRAPRPRPSRPPSSSSKRRTPRPTPSRSPKPRPARRARATSGGEDGEAESKPDEENSDDG